MLWYNTVSACGGPCNCPTKDLVGDGGWAEVCACDNCLGFDDDPIDEFREIFNSTSIDLGIVIAISFFITLGFYLVYKHKKDEHPRKHAIRRSWQRWIIVSFVILGFGLYLHGIEMENLRNSR